MRLLHSEETRTDLGETLTLFNSLGGHKAHFGLCSIYFYHFCCVFSTLCQVCLYFISGFVCMGAVGESIMQFVQLFSPQFYSWVVFKAKETNHRCFVLFLFFTLHTQYICNVAYPCKIMMYHSYLPWLWEVAFFSKVCNW